MNIIEMQDLGYVGEQILTTLDEMKQYCFNDPKDIPWCDDDLDKKEAFDLFANLLDKLKIDYCLILSEDGSTDNTKDILKKFILKGPD